LHTNFYDYFKLDILSAQKNVAQEAKLMKYCGIELKGNEVRVVAVQTTGDKYSISYLLVFKN
jgi:hypothetical protein